MLRACVQDLSQSELAGNDYTDRNDLISLHLNLRFIVNRLLERKQRNVALIRTQELFTKSATGLMHFTRVQWSGVLKSAVSVHLCLSLIVPMRSKARFDHYSLI